MAVISQPGSSSNVYIVKNEKSQEVNTMKKNRLMLCLLLTLGFVSTHASAEYARIHWADKRGIEDWKVVDNHTLHIEDRHGQWYEAKLYHNVVGLEHAITLGFVTGIMGELDRFSSIVYDGNTYRFKTFLELEEDPYAEESET
jgi:hypothetical protein